MGQQVQPAPEVRAPSERIGLFGDYVAWRSALALVDLYRATKQPHLEQKHRQRALTIQGDLITGITSLGLTAEQARQVLA